MTNMRERIPTVGIVLLSQDAVLLVEHLAAAGHMTGSFGTPAGRVDHGESADDAAVRELFEETGLTTAKADLVKIPHVYEVDLKRKNGEIMPVSHTVFATRTFSGELRDSEETSPQWIEIASLSNMELLPNIEDMVRRAQEVLKQDSNKL